jgi:hypothetical protein
MIELHFPRSNPVDERMCPLMYIVIHLLQQQFDYSRRLLSLSLSLARSPSSLSLARARALSPFRPRPPISPTRRNHLHFFQRESGVEEGLRRVDRGDAVGFERGEDGPPRRDGERRVDHDGVEHHPSGACRLVPLGS